MNLYRIAIGFTLVASLLLIWLSLGVGIIGRDGDPANRMYFGVVAVGLAGALIARFRARGMAKALAAMALAQLVIMLVAIFGGLGRPWSGPAELFLLNGFFIIVFGAASAMFQRAG